MDIQGIAQFLESQSPVLQWNAEQYVNAISAAKLVLQVSARGTEAGRLKNAQDVENFDYQLFFDLTRRVAGRAYGAYRRALFQQAAYGCGLLHLNFVDNVRSRIFKGASVTSVDELAGRLGSEGFEGNLFALECPDLSATFWPPDLSAFAELGECEVSELLTAYPDEEKLRAWLTSETIEEGKLQSQRTVMRYHLETETHIYDVLGSGQANYEVERWENPAGRPWYALVPGSLTAEHEPLERYLPLIAALYPLVQKRNICETLAMSGLLVTGRPMYQEVADGAKAADFISSLQRPSEEQMRIAFDTDNAVLPPPRAMHHWEPVAAPSLAQVEERIRALDVDIARFGFPEVLGPSAPLSGQSGNSGYQEALKIDVSSRFLKPALDNVSAAWYELLNLKDEVIKRVGIPVTVPVHERAQAGRSDVQKIITINPGQIGEHDRVVNLESGTATGKYADRQSNLNLLQTNLMSRHTFMEIEYDDREAEEERIFLDQVKEMMRQKALEVLTQLVQTQGQQVAGQLLAEAEVPLPPLAPDEGGPAPDEEFRRERPPVPVPAVGMPAFPQGQSADGQMVPAVAGGQEMM